MASSAAQDNQKSGPAFYPFEKIALYSGILSVGFMAFGLSGRPLFEDGKINPVAAKDLRRHVGIFALVVSATTGFTYGLIKFTAWQWNLSHIRDVAPKLNDALDPMAKALHRSGSSVAKSLNMKTGEAVTEEEGERQASEALSGLQNAIRDAVRELDPENPLAAPAQPPTPAVPWQTEMRAKLRGKLLKLLGKDKPEPPKSS